MLKALAAVEGNPDHVLVLSGETYPIKPASMIAARLQEPVSFVHHNRLPYGRWEDGGLDRVESRTSRIPLYGGSGWFVLHREALKLVTDREATEEVRRTLRTAKLPDEMFVHTVLANSPLRDRLVNAGLHYGDWSRNGPSPATLTDAHWDDLVATPALFARKFEAGSPVLDRIDRELL